MTRIQHCIRAQDWVLQVWDDRYSRGTWAALVSGEHVDIIRGCTSLGDLDAETAADFLERSTLLPIAVRRTFEDALGALTERLGQLNEDDLKRRSAWALAVQTEYAYACSQIEGNDGYGNLLFRDPRPGPFRIKNSG